MVLAWWQVGLRGATVGLAVGLAGCSIKAAGSVAQPTALELQLLGAYRKLDDDLIRASSIRAAGPITAATQDALADQALEARAMQRFNQDDVAELKAAGCLAETLTAELVARPCALVNDSPSEGATARRRERVIAQENGARRNLLAWAATTLAIEAGADQVSAANRREVRSAYARLLRQTARPGDWVEVTPGEFRAVER